jgi:hypothetical protein
VYKPRFNLSFGKKMGAYFQNGFIFKSRLIIDAKQSSDMRTELQLIIKSDENIITAYKKNQLYSIDCELLFCHIDGIHTSGSRMNNVQAS